MREINVFAFELVRADSLRRVCARDKTSGYGLAGNAAVGHDDGAREEKEPEEVECDLSFAEDSCDIRERRFELLFEKLNEKAEMLDGLLFFSGAQSFCNGAGLAGCKVFLEARQPYQELVGRELCVI